MSKKSYTNAALEGFGETYTDAALRGYGDTYTSAALRGCGDTYTSAALRGMGKKRSYTNAAIDGGISIQDRIMQLQKQVGARKMARGGKRLCGKGLFTLFSSLPLAIKGAKAVVRGIKKVLGVAKGSGQITPSQKKILKKLIKVGKK